MDREVFNTQMVKTALALNKELDELTVNEYWEIFAVWDNEKFELAMNGCRKELSFFPVPKEIIARYEPDRKLVVYDEPEPEAPRLPETEFRIDTITDDELRNIFTWLHDGSPNPQVAEAIEYSIGQFRQGHTWFVGFVKDAIERGESWVRRK